MILKWPTHKCYDSFFVTDVIKKSNHGKIIVTTFRNFSLKCSLLSHRSRPVTTYDILANYAIPPSAGASLVATSGTYR